MEARMFTLPLMVMTLQVYDYKMLNLPVPPNSPELSGGEEIIRCTEHDMEILQPLQKDYMKDEDGIASYKYVVINSLPFSEYMK